MLTAPETPRVSRFRVAAILEYDVPAPLTFLLSIRAQSSPWQRILTENFYLSHRMPHRVLACAATGTRFDRVTVEVPGICSIHYEAQVEVWHERIATRSPAAGGAHDYDLGQMQYTYPSRYCQSDRLGRFAIEQFGGLDTEEAKVRAILRWIGEHIAYVSGTTDSGTSAVDTLVDCAGVCRDFAHLAIALCRALSIPARYFTCYAHALQPPDFHACLETWIGGRWYFWDPTRLSVPNGVVRIGTGRDAADCSVCTSYGSLFLVRQTVTCDALDSGFQHMSPAEMAAQLVSLTPAVTMGRR